jgi:hypothetical protein
VGRAEIFGVRHTHPTLQAAAMRVIILGKNRGMRLN